MRVITPASVSLGLLALVYVPLVVGPVWFY